MTYQQTWMDSFILLGIIIVAGITVETCIAYYISQKGKSPPQWYLLKLFVLCFSWQNMFRFLCSCFLSKSEQKAEVQGIYSSEENEDMGKVESTSSSPHVDYEITMSRQGFGEQVKADLTWVKLATAIDMFSQLSFTLAYVLAISILMSQATNQYRP